MIRSPSPAPAALAVLAGLAFLLSGAAPPTRTSRAPLPAALEERLSQHRNLGKAFYENPTTMSEAVEQFRLALELAPGSLADRLHYGLALLRAGRTAEGIAELQAVQHADPALPHTWFNLGIAYLRQAQIPEATAQFERMVALVPDEPVSRYNLGTLYRFADRSAEATTEFEHAARLAPQLAAPHFQLYHAYRQAGRATDAARELATFQELKRAQEGAPIPEDLEWSLYSEIDDDLPARRAQGAGPGAAPEPALDLEPAVLARGIPPAGAGLAVLDVNGNQRPDLLAWSAAGVAIFEDAAKRAGKTGLEALRGVTLAAPGDFDNDGRADLALLGADGPSLWRNQAGRFVRLAAIAAPSAPAAPAVSAAPTVPAAPAVPAVPAVPMPAGRFTLAVWLDFDHDYDLDLLLFGDGAALLRNEGAAGWSDQSSRFPFASGRALAAVVLESVADTQGLDLAVSYADRPGVLYRDRLGGRFEAETLPALPAGSRGLAAADFDLDGWTDLLAEGALLWNREGRLRSRVEVAAEPAALQPPNRSPPFPVEFVDLGNSGIPRMVDANGPGSAPASEVNAASAAVNRWPAGEPAAALAAADFDGDGRVDLAALDRRGVLRRWRNRAASTNRFLSIALQGVKNLRLAQAARVEVKAGTLYRKQLYAGVPLQFGLGAHAVVDTVRVTWPNGLVQNETRQPSDRLVALVEAPRLSGSCPMIFAWDGRHFEFVTDVLGVAPLGASAGDGEYFPVDHDEVVQIAGDALQPLEGSYEIRITEELREVSYLDRVHLIALDHPESVEILTNDKFKSPPFPEFRLFGVEQPLRPLAARDQDGRDVLDRLLARDARYPDGFRRDAAGIAEPHTLEVDFGEGAAADGRALLVLHGWVDWADGSTYLGAAQATPGGLMMPQLQVQDAAGAWQTVIADMGIPAGKPKTIVVDLTGKFLSASRAVRILTSLCVYWDEIYLAAAGGPPEVRSTELEPATAELRFRGFSGPVIHPERKQPERFEYDRWMPVSMWNPTPGLYTRFGDVRPLLERSDDQLVIFGSGDELRLRFDPAPLPALAPGWRRDFLLVVDGWAKDGDANTAYSQSVEPLPFQGMSRYPYPDGEAFPDDPGHRAYRQQYNTRPALRLLRPLRSSNLAPDEAVQ